VIIPVAA